MADQLQKLVNFRSSELSFWLHEQQKQARVSEETFVLLHTHTHTHTHRQTDRQTHRQTDTDTDTDSDTDTPSTSFFLF